MLLDCPEWVHHTNSSGHKCAIYGIDLHPNGERFATVGGDHFVKIWSMASFTHPEIETKEALVATLAWHANPVNCIRWSHSGQFLASGSDDHMVMLYELGKGKPSSIPFGSHQKANSENWTRIATIKGHTMNVQDVAWSPDDRMLATCSIDNKVIIWSIDKSRMSSMITEPLKVLSGHTSWAKGVAWDPIGKYIATSSEDKTLLVWRVEDWQLEKKIREPFEGSATSSYFRRISWSPDGMSLCATNGFKSKREVAPLIDRTTWTNDVDLVGHTRPVACTRFSPRLRTQVNVNTGIKKEYSCCAIGSDDCQISIWLTHVSRPLVIIKDCFEDSITDLSWSNDGNILMACSIDGSIRYLHFDPSEIGEPLSEDEQSRLLINKFGARAGTTTESHIAESSLQLRFEETPVNTLPVRRKNKQPTAGGPATTPLQANVIVPTNVVQVESTTTSGKRRIAPVLLDTYGKNVPVVVSPIKLPQAVIPQIASLQATQAPASTSSQDSPSRPASISSLQGTPIRGTKRRRVKDKSTKNAPTSSSSSLLPTEEYPHKSLFVPTPPIRAELSLTVNSLSLNMELTVNAKVCNVQVQQDTESEEAEKITLLPTGPIYSTLTCTSSSTVQWSDRFSERITLLTGNMWFFAIATSGGSIYVLRASGRRWLPPLEMAREVALLESSPEESPFLLAITTSGIVKLWNLQLQKSILSDHLEHIMAGAGNSAAITTSLLRARVTVKGQPLLTFSVTDRIKGSKHLRSFTYHMDMACWVRIADNAFIPSDFHSFLPLAIRETLQEPHGILSNLQNASTLSRSHTTDSLALLSGLTTSMQHSLTKAHLEHQLASASSLQSAKEYQYWLKIYVRYLTADGDTFRLRELCSDFMGPASSTKSTSFWSSTILGISKRRLLKTFVLPLMGKNRALQRLVAEFESLVETPP